MAATLFKEHTTQLITRLLQMLDRYQVAFLKQLHIGHGDMSQDSLAVLRKGLGPDLQALAEDHLKHEYAIYSLDLVATCSMLTGMLSASANPIVIRSNPPPQQ